MRAASVLLPTLLLVAASTPAHAYEEQWGLAASAGYQSTGSRDQHRGGVAAGLLADFGVSDVWTARARADYGIAPGGEGDPNLHTASVGLEWLYVMDILTVVPYVGLGGGAMLFHDRGTTDLRPTLSLVAGFDYLLDRELSIGLDTRGVATGRGLSDRAYAWQLQLIIRRVIAD